jgi:thiosulfate sulfurtransferase
MDGSKPPSISPQGLYGAIGTAGAPILIDVRRGAAFAADNRMIVGAIRRSPDEIPNWPELSPGHAVVVYCVHGHEASQDTASALRGAGVEARYPETGAVAKAEKITDADDLKAAASQKAAMAKPTVPLLAAADTAAKGNAGLRVVSIYPQVQNGHPVAEVTLLQGTVFKKVTEKPD